MPSLMPTATVADDGSRKRLVSALLQKAKKDNVGIEYTEEADRFGGGAYNPDDKKVKVSPKLHGARDEASALAHELGHAEFDKSILGKIVQNPHARALSGVSVPIGMLVALTAQGNLARRIALSTGVIAAGQAPTLLGEGVAWAKGHRMLKELGAGPEDLAGLRSDAMRHGSTYLLQPNVVAGLGGSMMLSALAHATHP